MNKMWIKIVVVLIALVAIIGIFALIGNSKKEENDQQSTEKLSDIDIFYNDEITKNYTDTRELSEEYNSQQAMQDGCFIIGAMVHNDNLYYEFMEKYKKGEKAFIRVGQNTREGDLIINDIKYDGEKIQIVIDVTRDRYMAQEDRIIKLKEYQKIGEYDRNGHKYWVAYDGEITDETFDTEETLVITMIN